MSGTGDRALLRNVRPTTLTVISALGDSAQPTEMEDPKPHMIPTVLIDAMKNTTLLSVSQMCIQKIPLCSIFSPVDCRFFPFHRMLPYLKQVRDNCDEVLRGKVENGRYVMESNQLRRTEHPGDEGMQCHQEHTIGANYTKIDAGKPVHYVVHVWKGKTQTIIAYTEYHEESQDHNSHLMHTDTDPPHIADSSSVISSQTSTQEKSSRS
jgi:hypothetical protein